MAVFLAIWLAWEIPFYLRVGLDDAWTMLSGDIGMRFQDRSWMRTLAAPGRVSAQRGGLLAALGRTAAGLVAAGFPPRVAFAREEVCFLASAIGVAALSCYVVPGRGTVIWRPCCP